MCCDDISYHIISYTTIIRRSQSRTPQTTCVGVGVSVTVVVGVVVAVNSDHGHDC